MKIGLLKMMARPAFGQMSHYEHRTPSDRQGQGARRPALCSRRGRQKSSTEASLLPTFWRGCVRQKARSRPSFTGPKLSILASIAANAVVLSAFTASGGHGEIPMRRAGIARHVCRQLERRDDGRPGKQRAENAGATIPSWKSGEAKGCAP